MDKSYFKVIIKSEMSEVIYMVRSDKVGDFFNTHIEFFGGGYSVTVKGRFETHKETRKWVLVAPKNNK